MTIKEKDELIDFTIEKLTKLLIRADFNDKTRGKTRYVKLTRAYSDLIKLLKDIQREGI